VTRTGGEAVRETGEPESMKMKARRQSVKFNLLQII
jgi:hypothetical protein